MKKIVASASIVTLGLLCGQSALAQQDSKPWNITGTLRGFYDDNYATLPRNQGNGVNARHSFGIEVSPSISYKVSFDTTEIGAKYTYGMKYYEDRVNNPIDQSHQFDLNLVHVFSERYRAALTDSFVIAQEPSLLDPGVISVPLRSDGNNMVNRAKLEFNASITEQFGLDFKYDNTIYDYEQTGPGSRSALLDRFEHLFTANGRWNVLETSSAIVGYSFGITDYNSSDPILPGVQPSTRDNRSHFLFVGFDHRFNPEFSLNARAGGQYIEYWNAGTDTISPYVDAQIAWQFAESGNFKLGVKHQHNATDVANTQDAETTTVYTSANYNITPLILGSLYGQFQHSTFNGGTANNQIDNFMTVGLTLSYELSKWLSLETGYNFDRLDSDIVTRTFYRNRVFIGIRASY
jgi:hypothetical protein